jgi:alkanesulfonate monooxygenase SsuD/methylene tetrahydromethanopterin reductase-like flavin-dependent oxidoreductase (luciferase family)
MTLEFGVLYDFRNPPGSGMTDAEVYAETMDHIEEVERLGFDVVWITEHHFIDDAYLPSVLPMCAAVAMRTQRVTIGTAVLLLPLHDPLRVAEDCAVVDVLSNGRLRLGIGLGYKLQEFEVFGVDRRKRPPDVFASYTAAHAEFGRTDPANLCTFAFTYPCDDPERAMAELGHGVAYRFANYAQWYGLAGDLASDRALLEQPTEGALTVSFFADAATVRAQLADLAAQGVTSVLWFGTLPGLPPSATLPMFEQIAALR